MKIRIIEYSGEINKIPEYLNYEFSINSKAPGFKEQFLKEQEKAHKKYFEMKRRIIKKWNHLKAIKN